jgi:hypothetical protein
MMDRLVGLRNDLGLLAEEYDVRARRQVGNFPQAFSHVSLVNAAYNLSGHPAMESQLVSAGPLTGAVKRSRHSPSVRGFLPSRRARLIHARNTTVADTLAPGTTAADPTTTSSPSSKRRRGR